jgi:hypothetical protein
MDEIWAYRANGHKPLAPVRVIRHGKKTPPRVLVRFEDPDMEGREEWVSPARLKVPWGEVDAFCAEEARWGAVEESDAPSIWSPEIAAAETVLGLTVDEEIAGFGHRATFLVVSDVPTIARLSGLTADFITSHPAGFQDENGNEIVPWSIAIETIKSIATRHADQVMAEVTNSEAQARRYATYGRYWSHRNDDWTSPEDCAAMDADAAWGAPRRTLLRGWVGGEPASAWDEIVYLRAEIREAIAFAEKAISLLRGCGHPVHAKKLESELHGMGERLDSQTAPPTDRGSPDPTAPGRRRS